MRKLLLAMIYLGMIAFGIALAYLTLRMGIVHHTRPRLLFLFGGGFLVVFGAYLAWSDFFGRNRLRF